jgi:hypothetical protein
MQVPAIDLEEVTDNETTLFLNNRGVAMLALPNAMWVQRDSGVRGGIQNTSGGPYSNKQSPLQICR